MSDLAATNCGGCGCNECGGGSGFNSIWLILLLCCCGGGNGGFGGFFGNEGCGSSNGCGDWIWIIILLSCCGGGNGFC